MSHWMEGWLFPVVLGFFLGSSGYILYRFYFKPIMRYRRIKAKVATSLAALARESPAKAVPSPSTLAAELTQCYTGDLPLWFQLLLTRRKEDPPAAAGHLMTLAKTNNPQHARRRIVQIAEALQIKIEVP